MHMDCILQRFIFLVLHQFDLWDLSYIPFRINMIPTADM